MPGTVTECMGTITATATTTVSHTEHTSACMTVGTVETIADLVTAQHVSRGILAVDTEGSRIMETEESRIMAKEGLSTTETEMVAATSAAIVATARYVTMASAITK